MGLVGSSPPNDLPSKIIFLTKKKKTTKQITTKKREREEKKERKNKVHVITKQKPYKVMDPEEPLKMHIRIKYKHTKRTLNILLPNLISFPPYLYKPLQTQLNLRLSKPQIPLLFVFVYTTT